MCGINGLISDSKIANETVKKMNSALAHRGPDDEGIYSDQLLAGSTICLGHRRLSIIDLSKAGHQPMSSSDGRLTIVYNGEIYNYKELKFELQRIVSGSAQRSYPFQTNTDTEVILAAYERWGAGCLHRFNGMFAFAIWDKQKQELFMARDRLGIKPLYFYQDASAFLFSSEIRAICASGIVRRKLNTNALADYMAYQTVHAPVTILEGVSMLMPGHFMVYKEGELRYEQYWNPDRYVPKTYSDKKYAEVCMDVRKLLENAVECRLVADVPFGAFLSGGIDSSSVVGLMSKVSSQRIKTFSVVFDESEFSEAHYARLVSKKFNTDHQEIKLKPYDFLSELPNALKAMDHPGGDGPNSYVVSKATKNAGISMALSGLGGDELFAGYGLFKRLYGFENKRWINSVPLPLRKGLGLAIKTMKRGVQGDKISALLSSPGISFPVLYSLSRQTLMHAQIDSILNNDSHAVSVPYKIAAQLDSIPGFSMSRISIAEINTYMQNVLLRDTDQMSMAHALEVRVPFLDYKLVEYVLGIPDKYKYPKTPKKLLVDSMGDLLPPEISKRPKMGFTFPWNHWLRNELKNFAEEKIMNLSRRSYFNEKGVRKLWKDFISGDPSVTWSRVWHLVVLETWMCENGVE